MYYKNFTQAYYYLLKDVYERPDFVCSPRGQKIKEKLGVKFVIENPRSRLPFIKERNFAVNYVIAEAIWYLAGTARVDWISYYSKFWEKISDDGTHVNSAYGARIFAPHDYCAASDKDKFSFKNGGSDHWSQWKYVIEELANDNDSRRAVVHIRSPFDSRYAKLDVPCTLTLQFFIREEKLYLVVSMRSSDLILGIANDVPAFTLFQELMALELSKRLNRKIGLGSYTHISNSLHIYERNFQLVESVLKNHTTTKSLSEMETPAIESLPDVSYLLSTENSIRSANTAQELSELVNSFEWDEVYWADWFKILASHRAGKLNDKTLQSNLIKSTSWSGYHYFER